MSNSNKWETVVGRSPSCKYDGNQDWHANQGALYTIMKCLDVPGKSTLRFSLLNISIKKTQDNHLSGTEFDSSGDPHISCFKQGETSYEQAVGRGRLRKSSVCLTTGWSPAATRQYVVFANVFQSEMCKDLKQNRYWWWSWCIKYNLQKIRAPKISTRYLQNL